MRAVVLVFAALLSMVAVQATPVPLVPDTAADKRAPSPQTDLPKYYGYVSDPDYGTYGRPYESYGKLPQKGKRVQETKQEQAEA